VRRIAACLAVVAAVATATQASATARAACTISGPFGSGRGQVWLLRPASAARSIVVFAHGWTAVKPTDWHLVRFEHLCQRGSTVVFPRYQLDEFDTFDQGLDGFRSGMQAAFRRLAPVHVPVVAAGYSFGGALVNYYAADARAWGVPVPRAVVSIFPTTRVQGRPVAAPPPAVRFLILAGDRDEVVGRAGAADFLKWLRRHPARNTEYRLVRSSASLVASHEAPKEMTAASTRTFWTPIDLMVTYARGAR
jgi:acetyl esterase/lipase